MTEIDDPEAGLKRALDSVISHAKLQRAKGRTGKSTAKVSGLKKAKRSKKAKAAAKGRRLGSGGLTVAERKEVDEVVNPSAQQHGIYEPVNFKLQEVTEGGKRKEKVSRVVMNRGGTAVERWHRRGRLDDRQMAAIAIYEQKYRMHYGLPPRVVANWSAVVVRMMGRAAELSNNARLDAKQMLRLFDQDIFFRRGVDDFNVWQNVVIHDEAAGVAGSRLGFNHKPAEAVAQFIVGSIAHEIAALVIDQQPPDLASLLLDIDAPRKSRRRP